MPTPAPVDGLDLTAECSIRQDSGLVCGTCSPESARPTPRRTTKRSPAAGGPNATHGRPGVRVTPLGSHASRSRRACLHGGSRREEDALDVILIGWGTRRPPRRPPTWFSPDEARQSRETECD